MAVLTAAFAITPAVGAFAEQPLAVSQPLPAAFGVYAMSAAEVECPELPTGLTEGQLWPRGQGTTMTIPEEHEHEPVEVGIEVSDTPPTDTTKIWVDTS